MIEAKEVTFSKKMITTSHPKISLRNVPVFCASFHLLIYLDEKLNFIYHRKKWANQ